MAQWVKGAAAQTWRPEFHPWNTCKSERREMILKNCPLTSIRVHTHLHTHRHPYIMYTHNSNSNGDDDNNLSQAVVTPMPCTLCGRVCHKN